MVRGSAACVTTEKRNTKDKTKKRMMLKINMFTSHGDSTYPDVLFMRWRRMDGKEKHTNVNAYISIQRKPWNKIGALFQMCESSNMRKIWCLIVISP